MPPRRIARRVYRAPHRGPTRMFPHFQNAWFLASALRNTLGRRGRARPAMDSDPVRRQGPERDNAEGEVVLGASPPARLLPPAKCGPVGLKTRARAKPAPALGRGPPRYRLASLTRA